MKVFFSWLGIRIVHALTFSIFSTLVILGVVYATVNWPSGVPAGETSGGKFMTYFTNMLGNCPDGQALVGFTGAMMRNCKTISMPTSPSCTTTNRGNNWYNGTSIGNMNNITKNECLTRAYADKADVIQYHSDGNYPGCSWGTSSLKSVNCGQYDCGCNTGNCWPNTEVFECSYPVSFTPDTPTFNTQVIALSKLGGFTQGVCYDDTYSLSDSPGPHTYSFYSNPRILQVEMTCRLGSGGGVTLDKAKFWITDASNNTVYTSNDIACPTIPDALSHTSTYNVSLLTATTYTVHTSGHGCNGTAANSLTVTADLYIRN